MAASETVVLTGGSQGCGEGKVTASGQFTTNGQGGLVHYKWIRHYGNRTVEVIKPAIQIAKGDSSVHAVASDKWTPDASGWEQLIFTSPAYTVAAQSWSCQ